MYLFQGINSNNDAQTISFLIGIWVLNTVVLRFVADLVVKRIPKFRTAIIISFFCLLAGFIVRLMVSQTSKPRINSVFETTSVGSQMISFLPLSFFLLGSWILNSTFLPDSDANAVGYKNGSFITGLQVIFLILIGLLISAVFFFW